MREKSIDEKVERLYALTSEFIFIEYYSHENCDCYKIINEYGNYKEEKIVLCKMNEGIDRAISNALKIIRRVRRDKNRRKKARE